MNKKWFALSLLPLFLVGCVNRNSFVEEQIVKKSGVQDDANYQEYLSYADQGNLSEDGYWQGNSPETDDIDENTVHITFADNAYLDVQFYLDPEHTSSLETTGSYLPAGSKVFAVVSTSHKAPSSEYTFSGFRIYQYDEDENRELLNEELIIPDEDGLILTVTEDLVGEELSVEPIGHYKTREIFLSAYSVEDDDQEKEIPVTWYINDERVSENQAVIDSISSYIISCEYDSDEYFYLSSEPECFYNNNEDGIVIFNKREANESTVDHTVKLHRYLTIELNTAIKRKVKVKIGDIEKPLEVIGANEDLLIPHLKYGDQITILTDSKWPELYNVRQVNVKPGEYIHEPPFSYKYVITIPPKGSEFLFDPTEYSYEHGSLTFMCFGEEVTAAQPLARGNKITYEQKTAEDGYQLGGTEHVIEVTTPEKTKEQLNAISFEEKKQVTVQTKQPKYGGTIRYYYNGEIIDSDKCRVYSGDTIKMAFEPWEGWINNYKNGKEYTATKAGTQVAVDVDDAFVEDNAHKPKLTVILNKSIGNMKVTLAASGLKESSYEFKTKGLPQSDRTVVDKQTIGTAQGISISLSGRAIQSGTAVKILVEKTGEDNSVNNGRATTVTESYLVNDLAKVLEPIDFYSSEETGSSTMWYKTVKVTISVVDVKELSSPIKAANATVVIRDQETSRIINTGDIAEGTNRVTVTITPDNGYYITGKDVKNNLYQRAMSFTNCLTDIDEIVRKHPVTKYCEIELVSDDPYGTCIYTLDGKVADGKVNAKVGQKLELEYKITDPEYRIEDATGLFGSDIGKNDKKKTESIMIDRSYDGSEINKTAFGIKVKKVA